MDRYIKLACLLFAMGLPGWLLSQEEVAAGPWGDSPKPDASDETALKIIGLHIKAKGGEQALMAIKGIRMDGMLYEGIKDFELETLHRRPNALMVKSTRIHMGDDYVTLSVTDGRDAWFQELLPKKKNARELGGNDRASLEVDARLPYVFVDAVSSEHVYAYMGEASFMGKKAYVVRVWMDNGAQIEALFDTSTFHIINYRQVYKIGPQTVLVDRVPTGLTRVGDTWWDSGYDYRIRGKTFRRIRYEEIRFTPLPPLDTFKMPPSQERWLRSGS